MNVGAITTGIPAQQSDAAKAAKAGTEFEAVLLNMVLGGLQRVFSQLPGDHQDTISKSYDAMAMQALASGMARSGGLGIAGVIVRGLMKTEAARSAGT